MQRELSKEVLYESVKTLVEANENRLHLNQHKLFTLFSIAFQYLLYKSTKEAGYYIIRFEDSLLAEKVLRKAKDKTTRNFLQSLMIPRRLKYGKSTFYLDFFNINSWGNTKDLAQERIKSALVIKNSTMNPLDEIDEEMQIDLPQDYYVSMLHDVCPETIVIAYENQYEGYTPIRFPFIKDKVETMSGVKINEEIKAD